MAMATPPIEYLCLPSMGSLLHGRACGGSSYCAALSTCSTLPRRRSSLASPFSAPTEAQLCRRCRTLSCTAYSLLLSSTTSHRTSPVAQAPLPRLPRRIACVPSQHPDRSRVEGWEAGSIGRREDLRRDCLRLEHCRRCSSIAYSWQRITPNLQDLKQAPRASASFPKCYQSVCNL